MASTEPVAVVVPKELFYHEVAYVHGLEEENKRIRTELEAVKREAVEALKPFAIEPFAVGFRKAKALPLSTEAFRAARAFVEKHGRDG